MPSGWRVAIGSMIGLFGKQQPAALLAESLSQPGGDDGGSFGVKLAYFVAPVVVLRLREISIASFSLTPRRVGGGGFSGSGATVEAADKVVLRRGEVGAATKVEPNS